jgi:hypothetical protein
MPCNSFLGRVTGHDRGVDRLVAYLVAAPCPATTLTVATGALGSSRWLR